VTELPEGWSEAPLSVVTLPVAAARPGDEPTREFGYVDISAINRQNHSIELSELRRFRGQDAPSRARRPIAPGDVLFSNVRTNLRNVALVEPGLPAELCSTGFTVLRPSAAVLPEYVLRWVLTDAFTSEVSETQTGTHYPATSDAQVLAQTIRVPPLAEQRRIIDKVNASLRQVSRARERLALVGRYVRRLRQSVLAAACRGDLTADWRTANPNVETAEQLLVEIARIRRVGGLPTATRVISDEGIDLPDEDLPSSWAWCRVGQIADVRLGGTPSRGEPSYWDGKVPWVSSGEVANCRIRATTERITKKGLENSNAKLYPAGTVLIAMIGEGKTRGQSAILDIEAATNQNAAGLIFDAGRVNPEYVWYWALQEYAKNRDEGRGGNQAALNGAKVRALPVPLPPVDEQAEIVRVTKRMLAFADRIESRLDLVLKRAERLPEAVLAKAFAGELVATEADLARAEGRTYETADELLTRVAQDVSSSGRSSSIRRRKSHAEPGSPRRTTHGSRR
jgi:type I restriction enzyme, S subunit